ncbi:MAG TPA: hypothetical protein P5121_28090 [Caldilineaceae bacterium]|nr:hypothetical protein [Caldilineaceae bacterium]
MNQRTANANYRVCQSSRWEAVARHPNEDPQAVRGRRLYYPELAPLAPGPGQDPTVQLPTKQTQACSARNIVWADANATAQKQHIFILDVSADMGQGNKLASAKSALKNYVDRTNVEFASSRANCSCRRQNLHIRPGTTRPVSS